MLNNLKYSSVKKCTAFQKGICYKIHKSRTLVCTAGYQQGPNVSQKRDAANVVPPPPPAPSNFSQQPNPQFTRPPPPPPPSPNQNKGGGDGFTRALIVAAFVSGLGAGVYFGSDITLSPTNVASTELVDRRTPNSELCMAYGYSAMVFDQRLFVSFNPFNVYVTQPEVKPGCVFRRSNMNILENSKLVSPKDVDSCKRNMNTFAFVGDLKDSPQVSCVYHSEEAENQYLINPKKLVPQNTPVPPSPQ